MGPVRREHRSTFLPRPVALVAAISHAIVACAADTTPPVSTQSVRLTISVTDDSDGKAAKQIESAATVIRANSGDVIPISFKNRVPMTAELPAGSYHFSRIGIAKCGGIGFEVYPGEDAVDLGEIRVNFNLIEYPSRIELSGTPEQVSSKFTAEASSKTKNTAATERTFWIAPDAHCYASIDHTETAIAKGVIIVGLAVGLIVLLGLSAIGQGSASGPFFGQ